MIIHSLKLILIKCNGANVDIDDPTGELAAQLTEKYLGTAEMGNFTSMTPGLTDVGLTKYQFV
jgi:hypothetical protein